MADLSLHEATIAFEATGLDILLSIRSVERMLNKSASQTQASRNPEVDTLRGLALFGICVVNVLFMAQPLEQTLIRQSGIDGFAQFAVEWLFQGKFFILFSFLFGWGFALQMASNREGISPRIRFLRRLASLALIGVLHATLVFFGDILVLYAILGLPLLLVSRATPRRLMIIALLLLPVAALALFVLTQAFADLSASTQLGSGANGYLGTFLEGVYQRLRDWPSAFIFNLLFNGPLAFAAFCSGLAAAKSGFLERESATYESLRKRVWMLLAVGLPGNAMFALAAGGELGDGLLGAIAFASLAFFGPCLAAVYLIAAIEAARRNLFQGATVAAGRMSLTAYVLEGILAGVIFNGYGIGLYGSVGALGCFAIAVLIYACTHLFADLWFRAFGLGPLERVLRRLTNGPARPAPSDRGVFRP